MKMIENEKQQLSALVIGGSGHGKSEFILSFINRDHRKKVPASGEGQTTRTSMEYHIDCDKEVELEIQIKLKSKKKFLEERLLVLETELPKKELLLKRRSCLRLRGYLIEDDAFFHINEFGKEAEKEIIEKYESIFTKEFFQSVKDEDPSIGEEKVLLVDSEVLDGIRKTLNMKTVNQLDNGPVELIDCFEVFLSYTYDYCKEILATTYDAKALSDLSKYDSSVISSFLKTEEGSASYSSLVEKVIINTHVAEYYKSLFSNLKVESLMFVDTYGLNHAEVAGQKTVENRYRQLFNNDYPSIETVLYLRNINGDDAASDLKQNIPLIFDIAPKIVPYIIFTKIDLAGKSWQGKKAFKAIEKIENDIGSALEEQNVSNQLIDNRLDILLENRIGYCSRVGEKIEYESYLEDNEKSLQKVFSAIRYKKHLGKAFVPINKLKLEKLANILDIKKILTKESDLKFGSNYPNRTKGALRSRLQKGNLGFTGSTTDSSLWSDLLSKSFNDYFKTITERKIEGNDVSYEWSEYLGSENENLLITLSELFVGFSDSLYKCARDTGVNFYNYGNSGTCLECDMKKDCIKEIIYNYKEDLIHGGVGYVGSWLNDVYNFSKSVQSDSSPVQENIQKIINSKFENVFIEQSRQHNARIVALELSNDYTQDELETEIDEYYQKFDSKLDDEEKIEFEQLINAHI